MGMIFFLSHQPGDAVLLPDISGLDKLAHILAYGCLAGTFLYGLHPFISKSKQKNVAVLVVLFCIIYGVADEYHQSFIPGRFVSLGDVLADALGALLVTGCWFLRVKWRKENGECKK
jgi:VanZ family protein